MFKLFSDSSLVYLVDVNPLVIKVLPVFSGYGMIWDFSVVKKLTVCLLVLWVSLLYNKR